MTPIDFSKHKVNYNGRVVLLNIRDRNIVSVLPYSWVGRVNILDESESRELIGTELKENMYYEDWLPITKEVYRNIERKYKEAWGIRRNMLLRNILTEDKKNAEVTL